MSWKTKTFEDSEEVQAMTKCVIFLNKNKITKFTFSYYTAMRYEDSLRLIYWSTRR